MATGRTPSPGEDHGIWSKATKWTFSVRLFVFCGLNRTRKAAYRSNRLCSKEKQLKLYKRLNRDKQIVMHTRPLLCNWTHECVLLVVIFFNHSKAFQPSLLRALRVSELTRAETQGGRREYSRESKQNKMWQLDLSYVMSLTSSLTSAYLHSHTH